MSEHLQALFAVYGPMLRPALFVFSVAAGLWLVDSLILLWVRS